MNWCYRFLKRHGFSIRRVSHIGQNIPSNMQDMKQAFINEVIMKKKLYIPPEEIYILVNMDETPFFLEMAYETTIEFTGKKNIEIETSGRDHYRISVILSVAGDGTKLPPLVIIKGEPGKTIEKDLRNLHFIKEKFIYVYCQKDGWCNTFIFKEWINNIFLQYEKELGAKCLLILDKAASHVSIESIEYMNKKNVNYVIIPAGMTPICQPLDISINKIFKDNIKFLFEQKRIYF